MSIKQVLLLLSLISTSAYAVNLRDYSPYDYEVLFTNPECKFYFYREQVFSQNGQLLYHKPKNAYCSYDDTEVSGTRNTSPRKRLIDWIRDPQTTEIFMAYLSFSNSAVIDELCKAVEERNIKLKFVIDSTSNSEKVQKLVSCRTQVLPLNGEENVPELLVRGHEGGIGYSHNKVFIVNPNSKNEIKISFSSGNMSSGTVLHHENWHFITTNVQSYFAQSHLCLMKGVQEAKSKASYKEFINNCQAKITAPEEDDIKIFFAPGQGEEAIKYIEKGILNSTLVDVAAHRFFLTNLIDGLDNGLQTGLKVRLVLDDDIYWVGTKNDQVGDNAKGEFLNAKRLADKGAELRYVQTNHELHLLHHNKFIIFDNYKYFPGVVKDPLFSRPAVFAGAGNFTNSAFKMSSSNTNYENFYYITIPEVVSAFQNQFIHLFYILGSTSGDMPRRNLPAFVLE